MTASIKTLFEDKEKTKELYPRTKTQAVTNNEGTNLDILLEDKADTSVVSKLSKVANDNYKELKEATELLIDYPDNITDITLSSNPIVRTGDNVTITYQDNELNIESSFLGDRWIAFPLPDRGSEKEFHFQVIVDDPSKISDIRLEVGPTESSTGFPWKSFVRSNNVFALNSPTTTPSGRVAHLVFFMQQSVPIAFTSIVSIIENSTSSIREGVIPQYIQGDSNFFIGVNCGINTEESAIGDDAGRWNCGVGTSAMENNIIGDHCTAVGYRALYNNTTGSGNTSLGEDTLHNNTTGGGNVAIGVHALQNSNGSSNVSIGESSLLYNTSGFYNTAIGSSSGVNFGTSMNAITTDDRLTLIGSLACKSVSNSLSNSTAIGFNTKVNKSNQVVIGNNNVTEVILCGNKKINFNSDGSVTWEQI